MQKKLFTLLTLLLCLCSGVWADEAVLSWNLGADGADATGANSITGASGCAAEGFTIAITGNTSKNWSNGNGSITYKKTTYKTLKNSNGAQNTITCPSGYVATKVVFYVTSNADAAGKLSEFDGATCNDEVSSLKDYSNPTVITKTIDNKASFTFTFSSKQVCFLAVVTYGTPKPNITTQPVSASYQKDATATALAVVATASKGDLVYQWYSCEDANKTNAAAIDGATSASYTPTTSTTGAFYYFCRVTDSNGSSDSDVATINVANAYAPIISTTATSVEVYQNVAANLGVTVGAMPTATIQWYSCDDANKTNPAAIDGATNATFSPSTASAGTYYFYAVATNSEGSATSDVITLIVNTLYTLTYSIGDATGESGTVPASVEVTSSVTLPKNQTLYKDGYTLTGWNDGSTTHVPGSSPTITANTTMTAVFTANTGELGVCPATVTWQFQTAQGAPSWATEGGAAFAYVAQMALGSENIDMSLTMDPSSGKIANGNWTDWTQMNNGTKLTVPVVKGAVLKLYVYGAPGEGKSTTTFEGNTTTLASNIYTYTATATGDLQIVIGDESYYKYLTVTYPTVGVKVYDYATSVGTGVAGEGNKVSSTKQSINGSSVDVVKLESTLSSSNTNYWMITPVAGSFHKGDRIVWTGCYSHNDSKTTTIAVYDNEAISSAIVTGENFANVNGGNANSPKGLTTGYFTLTADAKALYIGRSGGTNTYLTALSVVRDNATIKPANDKSTYVASTALDFSNINGLKAYRASAASSGAVTLDEVTTVPVGTPLILIGTADTEYSVPALESAEAIGTNLLRAGDGTTDFNVSTYDYILYSDGKFYQIGEGTVATTKAYLHCETDPTAAAGVRGLSIVFASETTGIGASLMNNEEILKSGEVYDLQGRKVANPTKGLYIVDGKKVIIN